MDIIEELLTRGVANIISNKDELKKQLSSDKKINVYFGIDPTSTKIHLGHAVALKKLQNFVELGQHVTFLIGDFTALIGDPSDKDTERPVLTSEEIEKNFETYKKQAEKLIDFSKVKVVHNSEWLKKLSFEDIIKLCQHFAVGDFVGRELIKKRLNDNKRVGLHELLYPVMQGYDSYHLDTDIQIGGTDQTFNMQAGRTLIKDLRKKDSFIITNVILEGTDGRKMSKSWGNAIWLDDEPNNMYAKVMAINDELIIPYFELATDLPLDAVAKLKHNLENGEHPMIIKHLLANQIVVELHDQEAADRAAENFKSRVQNKEINEEEIIELSVEDNITILDTLKVGELAESNAEGKRLIAQGGVTLNNEKITDPNALVKEGLLKIGKRRIVKLIIK